MPLLESIERLLRDWRDTRERLEHTRSKIETLLVGCLLISLHSRAARSYHFHYSVSIIQLILIDSLDSLVFRFSMLINQNQYNNLTIVVHKKRFSSYKTCTHSAYQLLDGLSSQTNQIKTPNRPCCLSPNMKNQRQIQAANMYKTVHKT